MADTDLHIGDIVAYIHGKGGSGCGNLDDDFTSNIGYVKIVKIEGDCIVRYKALDNAFHEAVGRKSGVNWPEVTNCCNLTLRHFQKVTSAKKQTLMEKLNTITRKIVSPNIRKFVKAGYLDSCLNLTEEGKEAIFSIWMTQTANEKLLSDEAAARIEEMEDEKDEDE